MDVFGLPDPSFPSVPPASAAPPAGATPRGPMTFGQILDRMFQLVRANLRLFVGIALVPAAGIIVYFGVMFAAIFPVLKPVFLHQTPNFSAVTIAWLGGMYILGVALMIVIFALYEPAGVYAALEANAGTRVTFRKAGRYIWLNLLRALIVMLPILVFAAVIVGTVGLAILRGAHSNPYEAMAVPPLFMLLYLGAMVYAVLVLLRLALCVPACVVENVSAWNAIRRSNQLTYGAKGRIFLLVLLIYAIAYAAFLVVEVIIFFVGAMVALVGMLLHLTMAPWGYIGIGAGVFVFVCIYLLWYACIWAAYTTLFAVVYHDQRLRLEGVRAAAAS